MILYIVRHGIAVDRSDPNSPPEPERPLTARGIKKTRLAALGLAKLEIKPDVFITSPLIRAVQTAEIFAEALGFPPNKIRSSEQLKPAADPAEFLKEIIAAEGERSDVFRPRATCRYHDFATGRSARRFHFPEEGGSCLF